MLNTRKAFAWETKIAGDGIELGGYEFCGCNICEEHHGSGGHYEVKQDMPGFTIRVRGSSDRQKSRNTKNN